ncbi:MAG: hypothetical protein KAX49_05235 [Halanaerobiales bacterium]|nr:hypothetical protein [Halanaerobiales bacterium]
MNDYLEYEKKVNEINKENEKLLAKFENKLKEDGLSKITIKNHLFNTSFYINEFLTYYEAIRAKEGILEIDEFFNDWFIRKASWSNESNVKSSITSINKFYKFMYSEGLVTKDDFEEMKAIIKESRKDWIEIARNSF